VLTVVLRVLVAALGLGYVAFSLNWEDRVLIAAGQPLPDGTVLSEETQARVVAGVVHVNRPSRDLEVELTLASGRSVVMNVPEAVLDERGAFRAEPGVLAMFRQSRVGFLVLGFAAILPLFPVQVLRWRMLLKARGLPHEVGRVFKLCMAGSFFNLCLPGSTGGDVVKAYYAARGSGRRTEAVMSVLFDRVTGLVSLVLLGGVSGLFILWNPVARGVTMMVWAGLTALGLVAALYFSGRVRRRLGVTTTRLIDRLPGRSMLRQVDAAAVAYRSHLRTLAAAVLISLPGHVACVSSAALAGYALGMDAPYGLLLTVVPVLLLSSAAPLTYQGLGVMEALGGALLVDPPGVFFNQIAGMLLMYRVYLILYGLCGAVWVLRGDIHLHVPEAVEAPTPAASAAPVAG
jgi:uncharacterized protein (TIRG00374 family)